MLNELEVHVRSPCHQSRVPPECNDTLLQVGVDMLSQLVRQGRHQGPLGSTIATNTCFGWDFPRMVSPNSHLQPYTRCCNNFMKWGPWLCTGPVLWNAHCGQWESFGVYEHAIPKYLSLLCEWISPCPLSFTFLLLHCFKSPWLLDGGVFTPPLTIKRI